MTDLAIISTILSSVKTATEIAKLIKDTDLTLEKAEMKMKVADLISALADAKISVAEVKAIITEKEDRIKELEKSFELKEKLVRYQDSYYEVNSNGNPSGAPYCSHCWEASKKPVHLYFVPHHGICPHCKTSYSHHNTPRSPEKLLEKNS